jgi:hypothetical protein
VPSDITLTTSKVALSILHSCTDAKRVESMKKYFLLRFNDHVTSEYSEYGGVVFLEDPVVALEKVVHRS